LRSGLKTLRNSIKLRNAYLVPRIRRLRDKFRSKLLVLSFSTLLFKMLESRKKRPLKGKAMLMIKQRMFSRWHQEWKREGQLRERLRVSQWRKSIIKKRQVVIMWYLQIVKEKEQRKRLKEWNIK